MLTTHASLSTQKRWTSGCKPWHAFIVACAMVLLLKCGTDTDTCAVHLAMSGMHGVSGFSWDQLQEMLMAHSNMTLQPLTFH